MRKFISKYKHAFMLLYVFIYMPWFVYLENTVVNHYNDMHIFIDDLIPFNEFFLIPYYLWFAYVAIGVAYFFFTNVDEYYKLTVFLFVGMTICLFICTIYPNGQNLRPTEFARDNILVDLVKRLYVTDTCTNVFPSIHVYNSIGIHIAVSKNARLRNNKIVYYFSLVLCVSIILATMFLKQHSMLDVIGSIILSSIMYYLVYKLDVIHLFRTKKQKAAHNLV